MFPDKSAIRLLCAAVWAAWLSFSGSLTIKPAGTTSEPKQQSAKNAEQERERAYSRQQFNKNFHDLQILGQNLLKEHEANRLTSDRLAKDSKSINKCAKALRTLTTLGRLANPQKISKEISTPQEYDESIHRLAKLIWDFAHNPVHQSSKVFNMDHAQRAQTDLLTIIDLSKVIETRARGYAHAVHVTQ